jgi:hypothetical protein
MTSASVEQASPGRIVIGCTRPAAKVCYGNFMRALLALFCFGCEHDCTSYPPHDDAAINWRSASLTVGGQSAAGIETTASFVDFRSDSFAVSINLSDGGHAGIECSHDMTEDVTGTLVDLCGARTSLTATSPSYYHSHTPAGTITVEDASRTPAEGGGIHAHARVLLDVDTDLPDELDPTMPPAHLVLQGTIELTSFPVPYTYKCGGGDPFPPLKPGSLPGGG